MFNSVDSDRFICLFDYAACHSSISLSRVDVVILFNSVGNPLNDIKALKRITIDSPCERLNVFRLYSAFTIEEKALILSKQDTTLDSYISSSVCHPLLAWGASYLFTKLQSCTDSRHLPYIDDVVHELSSLLRNTRVKTDATNCSIISNAQMQNGAYSGNILLFGETESHTKENSSVEEYLIDNAPCDFWRNLVKQSQHRPNNSCSRLSRRAQKPPSWFEYENQSEDETTTLSVRKKLRSKRKVNEKVGRKRAGTSRPPGSDESCENVNEKCTHQDDPQTESQSLNLNNTHLPIPPSTSISDSVALNPRTSQGQQSQNDDQLPQHTSSSMPFSSHQDEPHTESPSLNPRTHGGQQSQNDQPPPHTSRSTPLQTEIERLEKEREQITKSYQEKKSMLLFECEKEISEVQKKYNASVHDSETRYTNEIKILEDYQKLVNSNKLLAEILAQSWQNNLKLNQIKLHLKRKQKDTSSFQILQIPASAMVRPKNPCLTSGSTSYSLGHSLAGSGLRAPAPHLKSNPSMIPSFHNWTAIGEPVLEPLPTLSTTQTQPCIQTEKPCLTSGPTTYSPGNGLAGSGLLNQSPHFRSNPSMIASFHNQPATGEPFLLPLPSLLTTQTLPYMQTELDNQLYEAYGDLTILSPMEFERIYDEVGSSLTIFGPTHGTF